MKCEIQFEKLKQAVSLVERVAGKHLTLPVLSCVFIEANKNTVIFRATNLDIGIEVSVPAKTGEIGFVAVPAHTLSSFLSNIYGKEQVVSLESVSENLQIKLSRSKGVIKTFPADDFPAIPAVNGEEAIQLPAEALLKGIRAVWYSAAVSSVKPELSSVYIRQESEDAIFAATDSFRLAEKKVRLPKSAKFNDLLIPFKNCADLIRSLESMGPTVTMRAAKNLVSFSNDDISITSRVIDGVFPDYRQIIPKGYTTEAVLLKQDMANALKTSMVFSDAFNQVHMAIDPKSKAFEVRTKNNDVGENETRLDAALSGEAIEANFNCKYLSDGFQSMESDSLSLQFNGRNRPLVIRPISGDQSFLYLVMPMNR